MFSGVLLTAMIFVALMSAREQCVRYYQETFDRDGHYDILIGNSDDEILANVTDGRSGYTYGSMYVLGEMATPTAASLTGRSRTSTTCGACPSTSAECPKPPTK